MRPKYGFKRLQDLGAGLIDLVVDRERHLYGVTYVSTELARSNVLLSQRTGSELMSYRMTIRALSSLPFALLPR